MHPRSRCSCRRAAPRFAYIPAGGWKVGIEGGGEGGSLPGLMQCLLLSLETHEKKSVSLILRQVRPSTNLLVY